MLPKMAKSLKERAEAKVMEFWETWGARGENVVSGSMQVIAPDFVGFGTEIHEKWVTKEDLEQQLQNELEFVPDPFTVTFKSINTITSGSVAVCLADMIIRFEVRNKTFEADPFRFVAVLKEIDGELLFLSAASSRFDSYQHDQVPWPGLSKPRRFDEVSILFADFKGFTKTVSTMPPEKLVNELNAIFSEFDDLVTNNRLEKVKTIGDAYMAVAGISPDKSDHALNSVRTAKEMIEYLLRRNQETGLKWELRVGIHSGPVVAGIIGKRGLSFDVWGDSVNIASRIERAGEAGKINISADTFELVKDHYTCDYRGKIEAKGKGAIDMYFVKSTASLSRSH
ncbi:MAG: adenylate/guanylate cyclase domain-containing protein [Gammaproteobacteria bacterium]|nr:adenylate/guanylate cyclase domain-containing protein [Gammaproteobacteria bacterium]